MNEISDLNFTVVDTIIFDYLFSNHINIYDVLKKNSQYENC